MNLLGKVSLVIGMSVSPALVVFPSTAVDVEEAGVRPAQAAPQPVAGSAPSGESGSAQVHSPQASLAEDEVKVQWEPPGEIAVYRFLNQQGTLVLQVPPQQVLNLAVEIATELDKETAPQPATASAGGKNHGR